MLACVDGDVVKFGALAFADYWGEFDDFGSGSENDGDFRLLIRSFQCFCVQCTVERLGISIDEFSSCFFVCYLCFHSTSQKKSLLTSQSY